MFVKLNCIFFEGDAGGGGGAAPAAPAAPAPAAPAPGAPAPAPGAPAPTSAPAAGPDYGKQITEWGGEATVADAVALHKALQTPEGVKALFMEAGRAQGVGDDKLEALFKKEVAAGGDPIEALLADPDRQLTAKEVVQLLEAREAKLRSDIASEAGASSRASAMETSINSTLTELKVSDDDRAVVLALADKALGKDAANATPQEAAAAIRKGAEAFEKLVTTKAEAYVKEKHEKRQQLPAPLSGGTAPGGTPLPAPTSLAEAKARVRQQLADAQ